MCTILTISRHFFENNQEAFDHRTKMDASINRDGFAITMLGRSDKDVQTIQTMSYETAMNLIKNNKNWHRLFLHSRAATTSTKNVLTCHNFFSVGNGENNYREKWIVQHNGYVGQKPAREYLVDSMYIAEMLSAYGVDTTIQTLLKDEQYTNAFFINPATGEYRVVRCGTNTLYTDGNGNYSTKIIGDVKIPVPAFTSHRHFQDLEKTAVSRYYSPTFYGYGASRYTSRYVGLGDDDDLEISEKDWDRQLMEELTAADKLSGLSESETQDIVEEIVSYDIDLYGEEAVAYQYDKVRFFSACDQLGFGVFRKIPNSIYSQLDYEQKGWFKEFKENAELGETVYGM